MLAVASGELGEAGLATWIREHIQAPDGMPESPVALTKG
jgi:hypothetical protein